MNPYLVFTNIFNKSLNPYILSSCSNIFHHKLSSKVLNKLKNDNENNENSISIIESPRKNNCNNKENKKPLNRWQLFVKSNYNNASSILNTRLLIPIIKFLSVEYRKIYVVKKEKPKNQDTNIDLCIDNKEDVDMHRDDMDLDNDHENELICIFNNLKIN